ncbi:MAG TPA: formylglycine-generating enzyme family protein [Rhodothermales bacterium]|nr:formylglycine-generating enzyme family protein [Rhodothermales bacterium]
MRIDVFAILVVSCWLSGCCGPGETRRPSPDRPEAAGPGIGSTFVDTIPGSGVSFEMAYMAGGTFLIGSPETEAGRDPDEGPQRVVSIDPFWIGVREVTWDEFDVFRRRELDSDTTATSDSTFSADAVARPSPAYEDPSHGMGANGFPAVSMTQWAALNYAEWLSRKTGRFYRLPTEAEWEFACRAGSSTAFSFGDELDSLDMYAWYWDNSGEVFHQGGTRRPNDWGVFDMHGNVAEWTLDQYDPGLYASFESDTTDSPWARPTMLHPRTVRGGAYDDDPEALRCAARLESSLNWKQRDPQIPKSFWWNTDSPFVGFRLVSPAHPPSPDEIEEFWMLVFGE